MHSTQPATALLAVMVYILPQKTVLVSVEAIPFFPFADKKRLNRNHLNNPVQKPKFPLHL